MAPATTLSEDEREPFFQIDYRHPPVKIEQFIEDDYYLGRFRNSVFPQIKKDLIDLFAGEFSEVLLIGSQGWGKCLGRGTQILRYDGRIVPVEHICPGDDLMGPDSKPRRVLSTTRGLGELYRVTPTKGDSYIVNDAHILSLYQSPTSSRREKYLEISAEHFCQKSWTFKNHAMAWRTGVDFQQNNEALTLPPYFMGLWLGDGASTAPAISNVDAEVIAYLRGLADAYSLSLSRDQSGDKCPLWRFSSGVRFDGYNPITLGLRSIGVWGHKHIPLRYKTASREDRLQLLAGLIDSDGELRRQKGAPLSGYRITSSSEELADDICFLARSLGFAANKSSGKKKCQTGATATYWFIGIWGEVSSIPVKIGRKTAPQRRQIKNHLRVGIKVEPIGPGEFFGFELDGNGLFMLGDFTVTHNTRMANIGILYDIYQLSCLREPAGAYGLMPGSNMAFINVSAREKQAQKVFFRGLYMLVRNCPYFQEQFPYEPNLESEIRFPDNVTAYAVAASEQALLGEGIFSAAFDEMNFMAVTERSKMNPEGGTYDQAVAVYNRLSRRIRTRMNQRGRLPGHLWMISSARYPNDFTERKAAEALNDKRIFVREYATWETHPPGTYMTTTFRVEVGDVSRRTRILDGSEDKVDTDRVIEVPMDFKEEFDKDPDGCVRDYAGIATLTIRPFIQRREKIQDMFLRAENIGMKHAFTGFTVTLQDVRERLLQENLHWVQATDDNNRPLFQDRKPVMRLAYGPYYCHIDLAKTRDAAGFAVGHVIGSERIAKGVGQDKHFETKPIIRIDLALQVVAPKGGEIQLSFARGLIYKLRDLGMAFGMVSYDSWGSAESIQTLNNEGFTADLYSVDRTTDAYEELKSALYDDRILCARNPILQRELSALRIDDKKGKVDHPALGTKDVSDAVAGVVHFAELGYAGSVTSEWQGVTTLNQGTPGLVGGGFESEQEEIEYKLEHGLPLSAEDIAKIK